MARDEVSFQLDPLSLDLISHSDGNAHSGADIDGVSSADSGAESEEDPVDDSDDDSEEDSDDDSDGLPTGSPRLAIWKLKDEELFTPERERQIEIYLEQLTRSEGFDIDFALLTYWYTFRIQPVVGDEDFHMHLTAWEMVDEVAKYAIDEYNREQGGKLQFEKVMYANWERAMGTMFYITFLAKDLSSPEKEPRLYQTKFREFAGFKDTEIFIFRPRPPGELVPGLNSQIIVPPDGYRGESWTL